MNSNITLYTKEVREASLLHFFSLLLYMWLLNMFITFPYKLSFLHILFCYIA